MQYLKSNDVQKVQTGNNTYDHHSSTFHVYKVIVQIKLKFTKNFKLFLLSIFCNIVSDSSLIIALTAKVVIKHLTNYLGHFPLPRGSSVLASIVSENNDLSEKNSDELTSALFNSPQVQVCDKALFIYVQQLL